MNEQDRCNLFSELIACYHGQLYTYIFAVVKNREDAEDLFQSVCLVLWRKIDSFQPGTSFLAWVRQTAKLVLFSFLRHKKKDFSNGISEELLDALAGTVCQSQGGEADLYLVALRHCKGKLNPVDEELLELRYADGLGSRDIADRLQRSQQSVCQSLKRIRRWLLGCIQTQLARQEHSEEESS